MSGQSLLNMLSSEKPRKWSSMGSRLGRPKVSQEISSDMGPKVSLPPFMSLRRAVSLRGTAISCFLSSS